MNVEVNTVDRQGQAARAGFPEKANPNRPVVTSGEARGQGEGRGSAAAFSKRSDPRHAYRPLTEEQQELATRYLPMARALARQAIAKPARPDELEAEAAAALVDAARTFDPGRGVDFSVFARPRIIGALRDYRRFLFHSRASGGRTRSPVFERFDRPGDIEERVDRPESEPPFGPDFEVREEAEAIIRRLPRSEAAACRLLYIEGKSCGETAEALGYSKGYVSRLHAGALERIRHDHQTAMAG